MTIAFKIYEYKNKGGSGPARRFFYITINGVQCFNVYFSEREVNEAITRLKNGEKP